MANTIIGLNDTPSSYSLSANKFLRVNSDANAVQFWDIQLDYLEDVQASGAYAPSVGQSLVYTADGKWRPSTLDIYSAGNGLNKSGLTLNVTAYAGGGLTANSSGVFITDIANVSGSYGNATHVPAITVNSKGQITSVTPTTITASQATTITNSFVGNVVGTSGQISVTGGTGNNSNATLNLVATGVTAATYGNATTVPQITVDTYGRIQNVDLITISGGGGGSGNVTSAFKHLVVAGQTTISSDLAEDTLTMVGAGGIALTTNAAADTLTITGNSAAIVGASGVNALSDIDTTGITNGQVLVYNSSTSKFEAGTPTTSLANSGVTAGTYGSSTNSARITVDAKGIITSVTEQAIPQGDITNVIAGAGLNGGGTSGDVTVNIENTGVTAGTYGNASVYPSITVNSRGQITSVSNVAVSGGGGGGSDQNLSWNAGSYQLTISSGNTVDLSALNNLANDTTPQLGGALDVNGQNIVSVSNGNISILPNGSGYVILDNHTWPNADGTSNQVLTTDGSGALSWTTPAGSYGNSDVQAYLDAQSYSNVDVDAQNLSITGNVISLTKQSGNVDLTSLLATYVNTDSQNLSIAGNVISLTNQSGNVDLTPVLANVTSDYGDSNVASYLSAQGYATQSTIVAAITDSAPATLDTLNELAAALGDDPNFAATTANSISLKANISSLANVATSGLYNDLGSRPTLTLANSDLTYDGTTVDLSGVGAQGPQGNAGTNGTDGVSVSSASLDGNNLQLTLSNSTVLTAGNVRGPVGPQGIQGPQGDGNAGVSSATVNGSGNLIISLNNSTTIDAGNVKGTNGATGATGSAGTDGVSITDTNVVGSNLVITLSNTSTIDAGNVRGPVGPTGPAGADGAVDQTLSLSGNVITISGNDDTVDLTTIAFTNDRFDSRLQTRNIGNLADVDTSGASNGQALAWSSGNSRWEPLTLSYYTDSDVDTHLNTSGASSGQVLTWNGSDYSWTAKTTDTDTDQQDISLSGNVISLTGQSGNVDLTSLLANAGGGGGSGISNVVEDTTPQLGGPLDVNGQDIVSASSGDIDLAPDGSGVVVFRGNATRGSGAFKLNCENNSHGVTIKGPAHSAAATYTLTLPTSDGNADQVLKTDGSGVLSWVDQSGGGGGGGGSLTIQDEGSALSNAGTIINFVGAGVTATGTGNVKTVSIPGGSGVAVVQRFKLNYNSSGQLDSTSNLTSLISSVNIDSASGGDVTVTFDSAVNYPPASVMMYGYDYANNKYAMVPAETTMALREIAGGGSSGSPTLFNGSSTIALKLRLRETETGASRSFGTVTHAWIEFVIYD